jgi:hypothetical protein
MPIAVPYHADYIPAGPSWGGPPTPDVNSRGNAFKPAVMDAMQFYPRWQFNTTTGVLTSRYLRSGIDPREVNERIQFVWDKHGQDVIRAIVLHLDPDWCQDNAGILRAYKYERAISLESSGVTRCEEMCFRTTNPRLFKRDATE